MFFRWGKRLLTVRACLAAALPLGCQLLSVPGQAGEPAVKNVLMICVDDLRPQLNCYGQAQMITPNIDRLAAAGYRFNRAYIQQAVCSPSRTSIMTGMRPDSTRVFDLNTHFRDTIPWVITLPQHLSRHGYYAAAIGKVYHGGYNDPLSWSEPWISGGGTDYALQENIDLKKTYGKGPAFENADVPDNVYRDGAVSEAALAKLAELKDRQPFFYAVGYRKPHLPFTAPKRYWDRYSAGALELPHRRTHAENAASYAYTSWGELRAYYGMPQSGPVSSEQEQSLIHGYYACVSYIDALIGTLLDALQALGLEENTIVFLWGDHGWHLGDHNQWCKHTNFERATRIPMIIKVPWMPGNVATDALAEAVDLYPTILELCGLPLPSHLEGESLKPILENPALPGEATALSQYPRSDVMGYSLRTDRYRYTEWRAKNMNVVRERELYDHHTDPEEDTNIVHYTEHAAIVSNLADQLETRLQELSPCRPAATASLVENGEFDSELGHWEQKINSVLASFEVWPADAPGGLGEDPLVHVSITDGGTDVWRLALEQIVPADSTKIYTIRFRARAEVDRTLRVLWRNKDNNNNAYLSITIPISAQGRLYELSGIRLSNLSGVDPDGEVRLQFGGDNADLWLDSVEVHPQTSFSSAIFEAGLTGLGALVDADPDEDDAPNLAEYAFHTDLTRSDWHLLVPGTGTDGLPLIQLDREGGSQALKIEFLRRRDACDILYAPEFCSDLSAASWTASTEPELALPIDAQWERVILRDHETTQTRSSRFARVRVVFDP